MSDSAAVNMYMTGNFRTVNYGIMTQLTRSLLCQLTFALPLIKSFTDERFPAAQAPKSSLFSCRFMVQLMLLKMKYKFIAQFMFMLFGVSLSEPHTEDDIEGGVCMYITVRHSINIKIF